MEARNRMEIMRIRFNPHQPREIVECVRRAVAQFDLLSGRVSITEQIRNPELFDVGILMDRHGYIELGGEG